MKRNGLIVLALAIPLGALIWWVASNTYWDDTQVPMPLKGEARTNPFYAAERFANALGARATSGRVLTIPAPDAVMVLHAWHWTLSTSRREAIERWVEAGGRLVVDDSLIGGEEVFETWSGIVRRYREIDADEAAKLFEDFDDDPCAPLNEDPPTAPRRVCGASVMSFLGTSRTVSWSLRGASGVQALRVPVGRGSVTVINATPFHERNLFDGDHGWLFVAAAQLGKDDQVVMLSERDHPSLLALVWQHGAPVVVLGLTLIALALWRGAVRFGPLAADPDTARRSLAEQIRGTGQFVVRHGRGDALHAATVRALNEAAQRRVANYATLTADERVAALARLTGFDRNILAAAVHQSGVRRSHDLRSSIALLESIRRQLLVEPYGT
jgi:hypothetical protein